MFDIYINTWQNIGAMKNLIKSISYFLVLTAFSVGFLIVGIKVTQNSYEKIISGKPYADSAILFGKIQDWREDQGKAAYTLSPALCKYAEIRAGQASIDFSHTLFQKDTPEKQEAYAAGYHYLGENLFDLGKPIINAEQVILDGWLESAPHRQLLEESYTDSCVACTGRVCVQIFGSSKLPQ